MIYCPNCGTSNRKGSRFCSECGEPLPSTGTRCPMCNTINPVGNVYCENCNARLVPMSPPPHEEEAEEQARPIKGFSLPTIPLDETSEGEGREPVEQAEPGALSADDWLDELREAADQEPKEIDDKRQVEEDDPGKDARETVISADIPDWLRDLGPIQEEAAAPEDATSEETPAPPAEVSPSKADAASASEEELTLEPADIPDWLRDLGPLSEETPPLPEDESLPPQEPIGEEEDIDQLRAEEPDLEASPEWLREILVSDEEEVDRPEPDAAEMGEPAIADEEPAVIEIPDWLKEAGVPPPSLDEPAEAEQEADEEVEGAKAAPAEELSDVIGIPSWLLEAEVDADEASHEEAGADLAEAPGETIETPDWLTELMAPTPAEEAVSPFPAELGIQDEDWSAELERAEIPNWLQQLRPSQDEARDAIQGPLETEGLLRGLRGLIPAPSAISARRTLEGLAKSQTSEASLARAELFQSLLGQPAIQPRTGPTRHAGEMKTEVARLAERWLVGGILLVTVLGMLLLPLVTGHSYPLTEPLTAPGATNLHRMVQELDADDHVLVAFDYGPPEADELDAVAEPVLRHVVERGARVSIVSTRPDGPLVAEAMMAKISDAKDRYTFIGYRPGAATAASQLLAAADTPPALLLVLTTRPTPLRLWIEQAHARYGDQVPLVAVCSAALEPIARPYLDPNAAQLRGVIYGFRGAAAYEAARGAAGSATQRLDALAAGHVAIVLLIVIGALAHALGGADEERV